MSKVRTHAKMVGSRQDGEKFRVRRSQHEHIREQNRALHDSKMQHKKQNPQGFAMQQLENLDFRLGVGVGATREREKLLIMLGTK